MEEPFHSPPQEHHVNDTTTTTTTNTNNNNNNTISYTPPSTSFDTNIIIITSVLLLLLICVLAINGIIKYALNWPRVRSARYLQRARASLASSPAAADTLACGIKKSRLKLLPTFIYHDSHDKSNHVDIKASQDADPTSSSSQCPICLSDFKDGEEVRVLPKCRHAFHIKCVDTWFAKHSSCPTCRADLNHALKLDPEMTTRATQVQVRIVITSSGDATPSVYRVLPPPSS